MSDAPRYLNAYTKDDKVNLLYRNDLGELRRRTSPAEYSFFVRRGDLTEDILRQLRSSSAVKSVLQEGAWFRIVARDWEARANFLRIDPNDPGPFKRAGIPTFEGDVSAVRRYLTDHGGRIAEPRRCYLDLETDSRVPFQRKEEARTLCWAVVGEDGRVQSGLLASDTREAEHELYRTLWEALEPYDQVLAWNGDGFDFPVIKARAKHLWCWPKEIRRWLWLDHLALYKRMNTGAESGDERQSLKLNSVANMHLGEGKDEFDASKTWQEWGAGGARRQRLLDYNIRDTDLLRKLEAKTGYAALFQTICDVCGVFPDSFGLNPMAQVDGIMLRTGLEKNVHFATRERWEEGKAVEKYAGAFVLKPTCQGIVKGVHVGDFASLYPSIIITWNMSPETMAGKLDLQGKEVASLDDISGMPIVGGNPVPPGTPLCVSPLTGQLFRTDVKGLLPEALERMLQLRKESNKRKTEVPPGTPEWYDADRKSTAYKVAANSFYGVMGSPFSRFFDKDLAEAITQCGAWLIKQTMREGEVSHGVHTIYGDTDSLFAQGPDEDGFRAFVQYMNEKVYPARLLDVGCTANRISLAYEKEFKLLVMLSAKKYIAIYAHYKGKRATADSKPEVKGLEWRRGDSVLIARQLQGEVIGMLAAGKDNPEEYKPVLQRFKDKILRGPLALEEIRISKSVSKDLDKYKVRLKLDGMPYAQPPHVRVAKELAARGEDMSAGSRVEYTAVPIPEGTTFAPAVDYDGDPDRYYLWEGLVFPPTMRLLVAAFPGEDWKAWLSVRPAKPRATRRKGGAKPVDTVVSVQTETRVMGAHVLPMSLTKSPPVVIRIRDHAHLLAVRALCTKHPGTTPVTLECPEAGGLVTVPTDTRVKAGPDFLRALGRL
jgi:DNA polymerase elongation subunit (family B)